MRAYIILGTVLLFSCGPADSKDAHVETSQDVHEVGDQAPLDGETSALDDAEVAVEWPEAEAVIDGGDETDAGKECSPKCGPCRSCEDGVCELDGSCLPCSEGCRSCELCVQGYCVPTENCTCTDAPFPHDACADQCGELDACERCICDMPARECTVWSRLGTSCCLEDADCDDQDITTSEFCPSPGASCVYDCISCHCSLSVNTVFLQASFDETGLAPFEHSPGYDPDAEVGWRVDTYDAHSGAFALYFGDPGCMTYYSGAMGPDCEPLDPLQADAAAVSGRIRSAPFKLGNKDAPCLYLMTFWLRLDAEATWSDFESQTADQLRVFVVNDDNEDEEEVFASAVDTGTNSTDGAWRQFAVDLSSWWGKTIRVELSFDSLDGTDNAHMGAFVDDIVVRSAATVQSCDQGALCPSDLNSCTDDSCVTLTNLPDQALGLCAYLKEDLSCATCESDADCTPEGLCQIATCGDGLCGFELDTACCEASLANLLVTVDFNDDSDAWITDGDADNDAAPVLWSTAYDVDGDGDGELYFGDPTRACATPAEGICPSYDAGDQPVHGLVESPTWVLPETAAFLLLSFDLKLGTQWDDVPVEEFFNAYGEDRLSLVVRAGGALTELWRSDEIHGSTMSYGDKGQRRIGIDVSAYRGRAVRFGFRFDSVTDYDNARYGALIDDLRLESVCQAPCRSDGDCFDGLACTDEACSGGFCEIETIGVCCPPLGACEDDDPCTIDFCTAGLCTHAQNVSTECCDESTVAGSVFDFENETLSGFTVIAPQGSPFSWTIRDSGAYSGGDTGKVLWFGNHATGTYATDEPGAEEVPARGLVRFPPFLLPAVGTPVLHFDLLLDTEWPGDSAAWIPPPSSLAFDILRLSVNGDEIWTSFAYEISGGTCTGGVCLFLPVEASLAAYRGQVIRLAFEFDSLDGTQNSYLGPMIDALSVSLDCHLEECYNSDECADAVGTSCARCTANTCTPVTNDICEAPLIAFAEDFDEGSSSLEPATTSAQVGWRVLTSYEGAQVHSGLYSLYFGDPSAMSYDDGGDTVSGDVSWMLSVPEGDGWVLEWWQLLSLDLADVPLPISDVFQVTIIDLESSAVTTVFSNKPSYEAYELWSKRTVDLAPFAGKSVAILFSFASGDGAYNDGEGIFLDDLRVIRWAPAS